jgi:hypothetical protein
LRGDDGATKLWAGAPLYERVKGSLTDAAGVAPKADGRGPPGEEEYAQCPEGGAASSLGMGRWYESRAGGFPRPNLLRRELDANVGRKTPCGARDVSGD